MKNQQNVVIQKVSHSRYCRPQNSGIYNARCCQIKENSLFNKCVEDPRYQPSGMTANFTTARGFTPRPSSPRRVGMRGIGAAQHGCPALQVCGMTKCVARGFSSCRHPEFISGSSRYNNKMLKQVQVAPHLTPRA